MSLTKNFIADNLKAWVTSSGKGDYHKGLCRALLSPGSFWEAFEVEMAGQGIVGGDLAECRNVVHNEVRFFMPHHSEVRAGKFYLKCDDWQIYAKDSKGLVYSYSTEMWEGWLDLPKGADEERDAVEKYALPHFIRKWDTIGWTLCPDMEMEEYLALPSAAEAL